MDIAPTSTTPLSSTPKSPEQESETPTRIQPTKPVFTNGVLKRHQPHHHHHHHHPHAPPIVISYKKCLKNHAASLGGHALDGCGEFMPSPTATPTDPTSLKCAACGCHRNFHLREPEDPPPTTATATIEYQPHHRHHPPPPASQPHRSPNSASPPPISSSYYPSAPHMLLALSGGLTGALDNSHNNSHLPAGAATTGGAVTPNSTNLGSNSKKRFRTKFTQVQKDKMLEFAERVGWKMQKRDEELVQEFCSEVGVDRGVLKVWMHNNKNTFGKKDQSNGNGGVNGSGNNNNIDSGLNHEDDNNESHENNNNNNNNNIHGQNLNHHFESDSVAHVGTNGSSSSS
ncbi:hypothetical protein CCACVL1_13791 [Corchorus capsularis]|uniref:ZF-HD dimerization-type domain-containing protein n=1 Tax=Corchorus capsularis TaxID=210143 RepID=A0A1R3I9N5_COCAP|nr:hypothetical protein CCACVL1_13791 [Corchorus capsularis]